MTIVPLPRGALGYGLGYALHGGAGEPRFCDVARQCSISPIRPNCKGKLRPTEWLADSPGVTTFQDNPSRGPLEMNACALKKWWWSVPVTDRGGCALTIMTNLEHHLVFGRPGRLGRQSPSAHPGSTHPERLGVEGSAGPGFKGARRSPCRPTPASPRVPPPALLLSSRYVSSNAGSIGARRCAAQCQGQDDTRKPIYRRSLDGHSRRAFQVGRHVTQECLSSNSSSRGMPG